MQELVIGANTVKCWELVIEDADQLLELASSIKTTITRGGRKSAQFGCDYSYSGSTVIGQDIPDWLNETIRYINELTDSNFNSCLINIYPKGVNTGIGFHRDNEPELTTKRVVSISLGSDDVFILKSNKYEHNLHVHHGDILLLDASTQENYSHGITYKTRTKDRISLTFRQFN